MVIYKTTPAIIRVKIDNVRKKIGGTRRRSFCHDNGDIPVCRYNDITGIFEDVDNSRGNAYAHRNGNRYFNNRKN